MGLLPGVAAVLALGLLSACGAPPPAAGGAATVPWRGTPAPARARPVTIAGVGPCRASQLGVDAHVADPSYIGAGPVNTSFWVLAVRNLGNSPCFVAPTLEVGFVAPGTVGAHLRPGAAPTGDILYLAPASSAAQPPFAARLAGELGTCPVAPHTTLLISPGPGLGTLAVDPGPPGGSGAPCADPEAHYYAELYPDSPRLVTVPSAQSAIAAPGIAPTGGLQTPWQVHQGERLHFAVVVRNQPPPHSELAGPRPAEQAPLRFSACPAYHLELEGVAGTLHSYLLNCAAARAIPGGQSETFAMQLVVPASAPPGPAVLLFALDSSQPTIPTARLVVEIEAPAAS